MATKFQQSVWNALKKIPKGKITTYSHIAKFIGNPKAVRAVGTAVGKNPEAPKIPCHRVVPQSGRIGKYSGPGGTATKIKLLKEEGISFNKDKVSELKQKLYTF